MVRGTPSKDEFPSLAAAGLYAANIRGDGNCLFNALSDQVYGTQDRHEEVRANVIAHMREHADEYKPFLDVNPGGGVRRNPKRKNTGAFSSGVSRAPSAEEIDRVFEEHLTTMARGGTWGDHLEMQAFAKCYSLNVKLWQETMALFTQVVDLGKQTVHIAYHNWEHYSSVRNLDGPHTGMPNVRDKALSREEQSKRQEGIDKLSRVEEWHVKAVASSLPFYADRSQVEKTLLQCRVDVGEAVSRLIEENRATPSSTQGSSSVERDPDSDGDESSAPNKKQDRRMSRATRDMMRQHAQHRLEMASEFARRDSSQASLPSSRARDSPVPSETGSFRPDTNSASSSFDDEDSGEEFPPKKPARVKINPPKVPVAKTQQKQLGPQRRGPSARDRKDIKKQAQKAARKERAQAEAATTTTKNLPILTKSARGNQNYPAPVLQSGIKTLYI